METSQRLAYLFRRYVEKTGTPGEKEELFHLILNAEHDDTLRRLIAETWNEDHPSYPQDKSRADSILREILTHRASEPPPAASTTTRPPLPSASFNRSLRAILFNRRAASILGIVLLSSLTFHLFHRSKGSSIEHLPPPAVAAQTPPADRCITLPDGSKILLHKSARLDYQSGFTTKTREVTLHGEAYFDIHKDPRPFIVHTGAVRTIVLGTAFNINANNERDIVITVTKGKVKVENAKGEFSILRRDEQLLADSTHLKKTQVNLGVALAWKKTWLLFNDVTMREAMDTLARRYHLNVSFANPAAENCPVTATFNGEEPLGAIVNVLSKINNMDFTIDHDHVLIKGEGCK
ncbi:FecR family protein [Puia sp.]|uniref:FecR family protein n=1 Tax=Puia sp. TaxID=2045100 RepID=UPI002F3E3C65